METLIQIEGRDPKIKIFPINGTHKTLHKERIPNPKESADIAASKVTPRN
jgi:hypothetical protein